MTETAAPETASTEVERTAAEQAVNALPDPVVLRRALTDRVGVFVAGARTERRERLGDEATVGPDEVRDLGLGLATLYDGLHAYAQAFEGAARTALGYLGEEQRAAHGVDDGQPCEPVHLLADDDSSVTIADRVQSGWATSDLDAVFEAVAAVEIAERADDLLAAGIDETEQTGPALRALVVAALQRLTESGKFEPQVTKIKGKGRLADQAARVDRDVARRARESMYRTTRVTGTEVKFDREES